MYLAVSIEEIFLTGGVVVFIYIVPAEVLVPHHPAQLHLGVCSTRSHHKRHFCLIEG